ncbi:hypothetical protein [Lactiplantibacillus herbarum]|uniref:hypothetical protein n=1 Tax=Lactiplantibacillus herbarum TaxID=1670446 RepID=UPI00064E8E0F|nr:hypothetical protein [Lactiplantibacillus herbarum]
MTEVQSLKAELFNDTSQYADIMTKPRHVSHHHLSMPQADRAAQFAPFAALTGYHELIAARTENYAHKHYPTRVAKQQVMAQLRQLDTMTVLPRVAVNYFNAEVGYYQTDTCQLAKLDWDKGRVYFTDDEVVSIAMANVRSVTVAKTK